MILGFKLITLALTLAFSVQVLATGESNSTNFRLRAQVKNFETINRYLEKTVTSDDLRSNFAMANEWLGRERSKLSLLRNKSLIESLQRFLNLSKKLASEATCSEMSEILEQNSQYLGSEMRLSVEDYAPRRIDRIVETISNNFLEECGLDFADSLQFDSIQEMYDRINLLLLKKEPTNMDPQVNMDNVHELMKETGEGAFREPFRLLTSLRSVSDTRACNEDEFMVVVRNLIAARQSVVKQNSDPDVRMRRIDRLVKHYATNYVDLCRDSLRGLFKPLIGQVDKDTLDNLRVILSESILGHTESTDAAVAQFRSEFTTPELVDYVSQKADASFSVGFNVKVGAEELRRYIQLRAADDPDKRFLDTYLDEVSGEKSVDMERIGYLYDNYIMNPCLNFLEVTHKFFDRFRLHMLLSGRPKAKHGLKPERIGTSIGLAANLLCKKFVNRRRDLVIMLGRIAGDGKKVKYINIASIGQSKFASIRTEFLAPV